MKFKLGKKEKREDKRTFKLSRYLVTLPPAPTSVDWSGKVPSWLMLLNDTLGDCVIAGAGHAEMNWTANASTEFVPTDDQVLSAYEAIGGYVPGNESTDNGCDMLSALTYWRNTGICGRKIYAFAEIEPTNQGLIRSSVQLFGCAYIGVNLPQSAMDATNAGQPWTDTTDTNILGGHCVLIVGYDANGVTLITWGQKQIATWAWLAQYMDECYCPLSPDFISPGGLSPSGFNLSQLSADLSAL